MTSSTTRKPFKTSRGKQFGTLQQIFDDIWWAWGTTQFMPGATFPRNMTVIREGGELVIVHPVLMPAVEQARIEALGPIKHIVRLGDFHGMDDALYVERYAPKVWAPPGATQREGVRVDAELVPGGELPLGGATLWRFEVAKAPETVIHLERHGGILLTCDSVQNWAARPAGCSLLGGVMARLMKFGGPACIGPGWRRACEPKDGAGFGPAFRELLQLDFRHIVSAHGPPLLEAAKGELRRSVERAYPG